MFIFELDFLLETEDTLCSCHVTYVFQSESTHYSCLNVKELLVRRRREIWSLSNCNWTRTHNQRPVWLNGSVFVYELSSCGFEPSCSRLDWRYLLAICWLETKNKTRHCQGENYLFSFIKCIREMLLKENNKLKDKKNE